MPSKLQFRGPRKRDQARTTRSQNPQNQKNGFSLSNKRIPSRHVPSKESSANSISQTSTSNCPPKMSVNLMDDYGLEQSFYYASTPAPVVDRVVYKSTNHSPLIIEKEEDLITFSGDEDLDLIDMDIMAKQEVTKSKPPNSPEGKAHSAKIVPHNLNHHLNFENEQQPNRNHHISLTDLNLTMENDLKYRNPTMKRANQNNQNTPSNTRDSVHAFSVRNMADALPNQTPKPVDRRHGPKVTHSKDDQNNHLSPLSSSSTVLAENPLPASSVKLVSGDEAQELRKPSRKDYHMDQLRSMIISTPSMVRQSYVMNQLCQWQIDAKKRCTACNKTIGDYQPEPSGWDDGIVQVNSRGQMKMPKMICKYHDGFVRGGKWLCCNKWVGNKDTQPCKGSARHKPRIYAPGELESYWQFHQTPETTSATHRDAVAFDCEMGVSETGDSELIRLTVIDYFTCEVLIDKLVYPDVEMKHLSTRFSGVTWQQLEQARRRGDCLRGRNAAREAVWKLVGPETIVIGHSADNDLKALRWIHRNIVDTFTLEQTMREEEQKRLEIEAEKVEAESGSQTEATCSDPKSQSPAKDQDASPKKTRKPKGTGPLCLKSVAQKRLGREIQLKYGHDSKEDAIATRDIAQWHVVQGWMKKGVLKDLMDGDSIED